ncbi:MAG: CDGSH iron-sulfur domain-containing protein, partial [Acidimicrobiia bacterium]
MADGPGEARVRILENGPYVVEGGVTVGWKVPVRTELGEPIAWQSGPGLDAGGASYLLCRCGGSASKPFCDG